MAEKSEDVAAETEADAEVPMDAESSGEAKAEVTDEAEGGSGGGSDEGQEAKADDVKINPLLVHVSSEPLEMINVLK